MSLKELSRTLRIPFNRFFAFRRLRQYHASSRSLEETVDWAMSFGRYGYFTITTLQKRSEILALANAVKSLNPRTILEIGTARGGTLLIWSSLASAKVVSCDLVHREPQKALLEALPPPGSNCRVRLLTGDSHAPEFKQRVAAELGGEKVDFLFIDGDHTVEGVTADYEDYREFVRPGGASSPSTTSWRNSRSRPIRCIGSGKSSRNEPIPKNSSTIRINAVSASALSGSRHQSEFPGQGPKKTAIVAEAWIASSQAAPSPPRLRNTPDRQTTPARPVLQVQPF